MPTGEVLTEQQRACMLRAVRIHRADLQSELQRLVDIAVPGDHLGANQRLTLEIEIECLSRGVDWLWKQQV